MESSFQEAFHVFGKLCSRNFGKFVQRDFGNGQLENHFYKGGELEIIELQEERVNHFTETDLQPGHLHNRGPIRKLSTQYDLLNLTKVN